MSTLLEAEPGTDVDPFAEFIGGSNGTSAYQSVGGVFSEVPKAEINPPTDYGSFADLVPDPLTTGARMAGADDYGDFSDLVPPSPTGEAEKALADTPGMPTEMLQADEQAAIERGAGATAPEWANNAATAAVEMLSGLVPRSVGDVVQLFAPAAIHDVTGTAKAIKDWIEGKPIEEAFRAHRPELFALKDAEATPAGSKERFAAAFQVLGDLGMAVGGSIGMMKKAPGAQRAASAPEVPAATVSELAAHARNRIAELEQKPALNPMEQSEMNHLLTNLENPDELGRTYGFQVIPETARFQEPPVADAQLSEPSSTSQYAASDPQSPTSPNPPSTGPASLVDQQTPRPEPTRTEANAASRIADAVPEYLRPDPELVRLINEPTATVKPEMKMAAAGEGGALFSRGGARATVTPKGNTPKGDTNFLRVEPGHKRIFKGLERKGAADVIAETPNKVGKLLSTAIRRHVDVEQEITGQLTAKLETAMQGPSRKVEAAFDELEPYLAARENGRPVPTLSPKAQEILTAWEDVAESTGNLARANDVQVFDPKMGAHRPMGNLGRTYLPRAFKPEVERVMRDPKQNPTLWNNLVDEFAKHRGISDIEAAKELRAEAGRFSSNDFMGNLEHARTGQLPEIFYDYDLRRVAARYIPSFSERMAQIIAYGQRLGPREKPMRENLWDIARKESENDYTQRWLNSAEDQAVNLRAQSASGTGMARAQTLASGLLLSSPTTSVMRNTLSGLTSTAEVMGIRRSLAPIVQAVRKAERANARAMGAVRSDIGDFLHADQLGKGFWDDVIRSITDKALKYSGYNGSEVFVRTHAALTATQFAKDGVAAIVKKPSSMRGKEALAMFKRMGVDPEKVVAEGADWKTGPETRKFVRTVIRDSQGGYRFDQVPLFANSNMGRFFLQFARWGTQRARNIWKNGIRPALGEEVEWHGKTMTRRDVRPLLKMAGSAVLLGEAFSGIAAGLFGRDRRDASLEEIRQAWTEDEKTAVGLAFERALNDIIMSGTFGIWSQPIDFARSWKDQSRFKNPADPPSLSSAKALVTLGQAMIDQGGEVTKRDLWSFTGNVVPGMKQLVDTGRNVFDEPLYEAQNDVRTLRNAAKRWAKQEGLDVSPRIKGDFRKSAMAPIYEPIKDALLVGDAETARVLISDFLSKQPDKAARSKARESLKASIKQSQPFRAGPYTSATQRVKFQTWARRHLSESDYLQTTRIQERYVKAAQQAGMW